MGIAKKIRHNVNKKIRKVESRGPAQAAHRVAKRIEGGSSTVRHRGMKVVNLVGHPVGKVLEGGLRAGFRASQAAGGKASYEWLASHKGWRVLSTEYNLLGVAVDKRYAKEHGATKIDRLKAGAILVAEGLAIYATAGAAAPATGALGTLVSVAGSKAVSVGVDLVPQRAKVPVQVAAQVGQVAWGLMTGGGGAAAGLGSLVGNLPQSTAEGAAALASIASQAIQQGVGFIPDREKDRAYAAAIRAAAGSAAGAAGGQSAAPAPGETGPQGGAGALGDEALFGDAGGGAAADNAGSASGLAGLRGPLHGDGFGGIGAGSSSGFEGLAAAGGLGSGVVAAAAVLAIGIFLL